MSWHALPRVAVVGGGHASPQELAWAEAVGEGLGRAGVVLVCGGRGGVMEAACRGAKRAKGLTIGILPGMDVAAANPYVDISIVTGLGEARNVLVVGNAQAVIAIGGAYGTLSEIALALRMGRLVVGLGTWDLSREGLDIPLLRVDSPQAAVETLLDVLDGF